MSLPLLTDLSAEARRLAALGFMGCTGGNLSVRFPGEGLRIAVTASGIDKGHLRPEDLLEVGEDGQPVSGEGRKPSDETRLHLHIYKATGCMSVCHGHPVHAVALSLGDGDGVLFQGIEMAKAFAGTRSHAHARRLPIVDNSQDMDELGRWVLEARVPEVPAVLVRGHGVYAWGASIREAGRHLETVDWLCHIHLLCRMAGIGLPA